MSDEKLCSGCGRPLPKGRAGRHKAYRRNRLGAVGVSQTNAGTYRAQISVGGSTMYLGTFKSVAEAAAAYKEARDAFI
jgi:hypothetical protein